MARTSGLHFLDPQQRNDDLNTGIFRFRVVMSPYRITETVALLALAIAKAVVTYYSRQFTATTLDLVAVVVSILM